VSTPQEVALIDVRKSITFCHQIQIKVMGLIENMSGFVCPHCGKRTDLFKSGGGARLAEEMQVPILGEIPMETAVVNACDSGLPIVASHPECEAAQAFAHIVDELEFAAEPV
jgi:Mrp family chromosome partitioning ATPase